MFPGNIFIFLKDAAFGSDHRCNCFQCVCVCVFRPVSFNIGFRFRFVLQSLLLFVRFVGPESFSFLSPTFHRIVIYLIKLINHTYSCIDMYDTKMVPVWMRVKFFRNSKFIDNIYILELYSRSRLSFLKSERNYSKELKNIWHEKAVKSTFWNALL